MQSSVDHDYRGRKRGAPRPKVRHARPKLEAMRAWAESWGAELRRNRDGSYDALLQLDSLEAWKDWADAASEIPGKPLIAARLTMTFPEKDSLARMPGSALSGENPNIRIIGTEYVYADNFNFLLGHIYAPTDGVLDETKAGLLVLWGAKA